MVTCILTNYVASLVHRSPISTFLQHILLTPMDAAEHDLDAKLYKASGTLLSELQLKLPSLIYNTNASSRRPRLRVIDAKCEELRLLVRRQILVSGEIGS